MIRRDEIPAPGPLEFHLSPLAGAPSWVPSLLVLLQVAVFVIGTRIALSVTVRLINFDETDSWRSGSSGLDDLCLEALVAAIRNGKDRQ